MTLGPLRFTNAAGGTADWVYPGPAIDLQSPASAQAVNADTYLICAESLDRSQWEIATGAYTLSSGTFARTTIIANSLGTTAKISFTNPPQVSVYDSAASLGALLASNNLSDVVNAATARANIGAAPAISVLTNSLSADVALNNTAAYFDGPSVAQGASGTWDVTVTITVTSTSGVDAFDCKLWDGTTVIASGRGSNSVATAHTTITLSGVLASPAGNIRISVKDPSSINGIMRFNQTGNGKDSTITAKRIA